MNRLLEFPREDPPPVSAARDDLALQPEDDTVAIALGLALAEAGCSYEAAHTLRPRRKLWKDHPAAEAGQTALEAQGWWNKNWRDFAQAMQASRTDEALDMLGDRFLLFWDFPPLLMHLAGVAMDRQNYPLAVHLYHRIADLAARGLPKMSMAAFEYAAAAGLVEAQSLSGDPAGALAHYDTLIPNPGNAMAHQLQGARLLVAAGMDDRAMRQVAAIARTAMSERRGYSRDVRLDFVDRDPLLDPLRARPDWTAMRSDPAAWLEAQG